MLSLKFFLGAVEVFSVNHTWSIFRLLCYIGIKVIMQWLLSEKENQLKVCAPKFLLLLDGFMYL